MVSSTAPTEILPFLTAGIPGVGGRIKDAPEDFRVDECPLYLPRGEGEHLYVRITKRNLSTPDLVARLSSVLGVKTKCIGVAGLKDAQAVTSQLVSIQGITPAKLERIRLDDRLTAVEILGYHRNRLRKGHHAGNRFSIIVRSVVQDAEPHVRAALTVLERRGVPNYFGRQRQGRDGLNYRIGAQLLVDPERRARMSRAKRQWYVSAYQSHLFNRLLARRIDRIDHLLIGDWAMKHENGACFPVTDATAEQPRVDRFEISPTGVLFGSRAPWASGEPGEMERAAAEEAGTTPEGLIEAASDCGFRGERRALRIQPKDLAWRLDQDRLTLSFSLPPGAYATSLLREVMKTE
ncbi:MAG TPA: tRNA pseudouridine(13) synthase TruD [Nitrospiraceae bacterium]|nr:tRNA pseudouridine(13) synthase TruD [Nitrospiraceae bacterium]